MEGSVDAKERTGPSCSSHIDQLAREAAEQSGLVSFAGGLPDAALFPKRRLSVAFITALSSPQCAALQYGWPEGSEELRIWISKRLAARGANVAPRDLIITSGAQQAVLIALSTLDHQQAVGVDDESYPGALSIFRAAGAQLVPLRGDAPVRYVMPSVSNPLGQRLSSAEREELLASARRHDSYIIEDDAYDETSFGGAPSRPLLADAPERVFHVGTFSKTLSPGLRVGWLVPPSALLERARERKQHQDLQASSLSQELLVEYLRRADFDAHLRRLRRHYAKKHDLLRASLRAHLSDFSVTPPVGGFSLFLTNGRKLSGERLLEVAIEEGVSFDPGESFRREPRDTLALRLCYSTVPSDQIEAGVLRLARALRRVG